MLIGLISDTHNQVARTYRALRTFQNLGVKAILHCGDLTRPQVAQTLITKDIPTYFVYGNNDDSDELEYNLKLFGGIDLKYSGIITLGDRRIGMAHGDRPAHMQKLAAAEPDYLFFGHSHLASDFQQGPTRFINPGALYRAPKWTYVTLDLATGEIQWHEIKED